MKITIQVTGDDISVGIERVPCVPHPAPEQAAPIAEREPDGLMTGADDLALAPVGDGWEWMRSLDCAE